MAEISSIMVYRLLLLSLLVVYNADGLSLSPRYSHRRFCTHQTLKIPCRNLYMSINDNESSNDIIESSEELDMDKSSSNDIKEVSTNEELDIDGTISSWSRLVSAMPKLKRSKTPLDELDKKILSTALPTMLNLMVVPLVNAVDTFYVGKKVKKVHMDMFFLMISLSRDNILLIHCALANTYNNLLSSSRTIS